MVMDVKGMIAVGTAGGYVVVYGFGQDLKHILGTEAIGPFTQCPTIRRQH